MLGGVLLSVTNNHARLCSFMRIVFVLQGPKQLCGFISVSRTVCLLTGLLFIHVRRQFSCWATQCPRPATKYFYQAIEGKLCFYSAFMLMFILDYTVVFRQKVIQTLNSRAGNTLSMLGFKFYLLNVLELSSQQ